MKHMFFDIGPTIMDESLAYDERIRRILDETRGCAVHYYMKELKTVPWQITGTAPTPDGSV